MLLLLLIFGTASSVTPECVITSVDQVVQVLENCKDITISNLDVPAGQVLELNLREGSILAFDGTVTFGEDYQDQKPLAKITGSHLTIISSEDAVINGQGEKYWDGTGASSIRRKPILLQIEAQNSLLAKLNILNCPQGCVKIHKSNNVSIEQWNIDVTDGIENNTGLDTHGFTVSNSSLISISNSFIAGLGDCVAVNQGSDLYFKSLTCQGSQGLTIRPQWDEDNFIRDVTFSECIVINGETGIRVVTSPYEAEGDISNVVYEDIQVIGILFRGIDVRQDLNDEGRPLGNIKITQLNVSNVQGNMTDKYVRAVYIWCGLDGCSDWTWSDIHINKAAVENACNFLPNGWSCW